MNVKRFFRRMLLALTCATALSSPLVAQDTSSSPPPQQQAPNGSGDRMAEMQQHRLDHMTRALHLNPDQVTQIKAIQDDGRQQMMSLRQDSSVQGSDRRTRMMAIRDAENTKVKAVLTDDQKARYDAMQANERQHQDERRGGDQAPPPPPGV